MATRLERVNKELKEFKVMPLSWLVERLKLGGDDKVTPNKVYDLAKNAGKHIFCIIDGICYYGPKPHANQVIESLEPEIDEVKSEDEIRQEVRNELTEGFEKRLAEYAKNTECKKPHAPVWVKKHAEAIKTFEKYADRTTKIDPSDVYTEDFNSALRVAASAYKADQVPEFGDIAPLFDIIAMSLVNQLQDYAE